MYFVLGLGLIVMVLSIFIFTHYKEQAEELNQIFSDPMVHTVDSVALIVCGIVTFTFMQPIAFAAYLVIKGLYFLYMSYKIIYGTKK